MMNLRKLKKKYKNKIFLANAFLRRQINQPRWLIDKPKLRNLFKNHISIWYHDQSQGHFICKCYEKKRSTKSHLLI